MTAVVTARIRHIEDATAMVTTAQRSEYDLCLLGPLNVTVDGRNVALGGPRQIAVLARLMVTPDQVVSMDQLIASVWDGDEPAQPHVTIRSYVSNLRRAIEPNRRRRSADSCLASSPPGYRLDIDPMAVDWVRFQRLVDGARDRVVAGDCAGAVPIVRRALALWRGDPCSGLPTSEVFETHRVRLQALRQTAVELLYESLLHLGEHDAVAAEIEAAIVEDPLRERLTELGMLAFYRVGRQSEALALGRRLRNRLLDDLGIDPSPSIVDMELRILNHDPALEPVPGHANPFSAIITGPVPSLGLGPVTAGPGPGPVGGAGQAGQALELGDPGMVAASPTMGAPAALGRRPGPLVGRSGVQDRLADMAVLLEQGHLASAAVVGEQGIGKTTVVRDAARRLADAGSRVVWAHSVSDEAPPLWPWSQVVVALIEADDGPDRELTAGLGALAGLGRSVAELLDERTPSSIPTAEIILAVTGLLSRCARRGPVVVVLEDLHWADRSTVTVLEYAISTLVDVPIALMATWREPDNEDGPLAAGLRSLSRLSDLTRIDLTPFGPTEVAELAVSLGRPLSPDHVATIQRRTDGNPLFVDELLAEPSADAAAGPPSPNLRALVTDRVERVHELAPAVLRAAALFRAPFTAEELRAVHDDGAAAVEAVLVAAVRGQLLDEADPALGTYRFRHPIVGEVLAADTLSGQLRSSHRIIGQQLLATDEAEASYHLAWSPDPADRAMAARIALDVFHRGARTVELAELDARIRNGLTAAEVLGRAEVSASSDGLVSDALGFLSWRARVEDRPHDWADNAWRSLRAARDEVAASSDEATNWSPPPTTSAPLRGAGWDQPRERPIDRLERAVLNLIGLPVIPAGPGDPVEFMVGAGPVAGELADAIEVLAADSPARAAARIHLLAVRAPSGSDDQSAAKALREAQRVLATARKRCDGPELAPVLATFVARFGPGLEPDEVEALLDEHAARRPGPAADLLWARHGYPALIGAGRVDAAVRRAEAPLTATETTGDPLQRAEAQLLWTRHLLWAGELDAADRSIAQTVTELATFDLAEPLPLLRQRRILRSLRGQSGDAPAADGVGGTSLSPSTVPAAERASPAELAFRLAHLGHRERASEHISRMADTERLDGLDLAELALLGAAASLVDHQPAARFFHQHLSRTDERLIVRHDGSAILGPVALWASFAASGAGKRREARRLLESSLEIIRHHGGGVPVRMLYPNGPPKDLPIEPQPNLKSARAH